MMIKVLTIEEIDDERMKSDNDDQVMINAPKHDTDKTKEEEGDEEQAKEDQDDDDQDQEDQADDDIIGTLVNMSQKEKAEVPRSSSSRCTIKETTDAEINFLLDLHIQQEIPSVLSAPLLDVLVSVIHPQPTTTTIPLTVIYRVLDLLPEVVQRVSALEKEVQELKQVDHSTAVLASVRLQVPPVVDEYLGSTLGDTLQKVLSKHTKELIQQFPQASVSKIMKVKHEQAAKEKVPKFSSTPYDQQADEEHKQKEILFKMMMSSKSYERHPTHKSLYDSLLESIFVDENDMDRLAIDPASQRKQGDKSKSSKKSSTSKESSKGYTPPKTSKTGKYVHAEETIEEATHEVAMDQPPRPLTLDPKWNTVHTISDEPEQTWFKDPIHAEKPPLTFDELMATPIDFSNFAMNRLKIDNLNQEVLLGPVYNVLKGTCQSSIKLEYNMEECYKALTDSLDWENPEGDRCPFDLSKPLPLKGCPDHLTVAAEYFFNNDLEYLKSGSEERNPVKVGYNNNAALGIAHWGYGHKLWYISEINKFSPHDVYSTLRILSVASIQVEKLLGYGYLKEIVVRRADQRLYKLKEGNFPHLHLNDIEDMLLLQLGAESYQKKLNLTEPQNDYPTISTKERYTLSIDPPGVVYEDSSNRKRLMQADELYKFSDGTLMLERRVIRNLEKLVGVRELEMDYRMMQRTV
ncbi:hypothetical protein Tco_1111463 [Tanacetum coccineum]|uniref:Uncharacterized protein n=1 Tax=Tanacetum coccineum TaxID=301880 RepID=A0ABQ5ILP6_9ASTR